MSSPFSSGMALRLGEPFQGEAKRLEFAASEAKGQGRVECSSLLVAFERGDHASWRRLTTSAAMAATRSCDPPGREVPGLACGSRRTIHKPGRHLSSPPGATRP